ncbi:magnesium/cobalt transporter CorA [Pseudodesulfovibrio piezophilus]|uniref:Magnesium transport protein CorA n=1 Tax=Pseudodesulfovibrio piezophilus (strain DSM 21447 / JCM 15486 / C1TLV30) TaxID=1322246 RepID=M1WKS3_PSEP2|nr:magnesium/cobalt transporter CorA [Pseudodesulfovibrio piezophilus]CCH50101.1 Magnesium and cobalt transport protein CorA [Pseudodesulfovibrio piezophilus C1TLV30]
MLHFLRWNQIKLDAAPGSLVYAGAQRDFVPSLQHYMYNTKELIERSLKTVDDIQLSSDHMNLLVLIGIHQSEIIRDLGRTLRLPTLLLEDVLNTGQRSKFTWADDETGFIVMRHMEVKDEKVQDEQVSMFWRQNMIVVLLEDESDMLSGVLSRIRLGKGRIRSADSVYLLCAILDSLVDHHMMVLANFSEAAQVLESKLATNASDQFLGRLYELKRETILLRNLLMPMREIFKGLMREDSEVPESVLPYLHDVAGHYEQTMEGVTSLHDIMKSMIDYQISLIGIRTNKVMQFLTVISTIFIPLTFIVGIYGMNFDNMPELHWQYGYYGVLVIMAFVAVAMFLFFQRRRLL